MKTDGAIQSRASFDFVRYANCWEDPELLLKSVDLDGKCCASIASGGDNSFALLLGDAKEVVAFDLNGSQIDLCRLKQEAIRRLDHDAFLEFLGFRPSMRRLETYRSQLRPFLSENYYDVHPELIERGVIHTGKFEHYFQIFRKRLLPFVHSRRTVEELLREKSPGEQLSFYHEKWDTWRFKLIYRLFFNRWMMGRLGRDPEFFRYVEPKVISQSLKQRTDYALSCLPTHSNPFLHYIMTGGYGDALPLYARKDNFAVLKTKMDRISFYCANLNELRGQYDFFNLSDIFEYMNPELFRETAMDVVRLAAPKAVVSYYNMMVPRDLAKILPQHFSPLSEKAEQLFKNNLAFFYSTYHLDERTE